MRILKLVVIIVFAGAFGIAFLSKSGAVSGQVGAILTPPTRVSASDGVYHTKVGVYWDAISGATTYRIFRNSVNDPGTAVDVGATPVNFFFDNAAPVGQTSFYWVRAENSTTVSELSVADQGTRTSTNQQGPVPPLQPPPTAPPGNPLTAAKATLGKVLFWDEQLSSTKTVACGTCHIATSGGADPRSTIANATLNPGRDGLIGTPDDIRGSRGVPFTNLDRTYSLTAPYGFGAQVTSRKTTSFINAVYSPTLFWDGRASATFRDPITNTVILNNGAALESQAVGPPLSTSEMAHAGRDWNDAAAEIASAKPLALSGNVPPALSTWIGGRSYPGLFLEAFGTQDVTPARIAMAIASYQRSQFSDQAKIDLVNAGIVTLTPQEQRGRNAFNANSCTVCHSGPQLSDNAFHYIGVRPQAEDDGHFVVTGEPGNRGEFKTPSLRNVGLRTSFFHNGQFTTLEQVVAFYNRGGDFNAPNKNAFIRPLGMNPGTQADLVAFLRNVMTDPRVQAESSVFERPQLYTESNRVPQVTGSGRAGSGGIVPTIHAISPPMAGNPNFTVSVSTALGNSSGFLVIDSVDPGTGSSIPVAGSIGRYSVTTNNTGAGNGWASISIPLPSTEAAVGRTFFARWYVLDSEAANGFSVSPAVRFSIFGEATSSGNVSISGRVVGPNGQGQGGLSVLMDQQNGTRRRATTSTFGYYSFEDVAPGIAYSIGVKSRTHIYPVASILVTNGLDNVDFVGQVFELRP